MELTKRIDEYLDYCLFQKNLSKDTYKAYRIDLAQFEIFWKETNGDFSRANISRYIVHLQKTFRPRTAKRKAASLKAFCTWLTYMELIEVNPFAALRISFNEPHILPRTIPLPIMEKMLSCAYQAARTGKTSALRDVAVMELLFAAGIRISELCSLTPQSLDLNTGTVLIWGKGAKERLLQIGNPQVMAILQS